LIDRKSAQTARIFWSVLFVATGIDIGASWLLAQPGFGSHARIVFALLPIPANLALLAVIVRRIRQVDEILRHVHLEAVAIAFLLIYEDLRKAHCVGPLNVGIAWVCMALFYGIGYVIAVRHYR
jgi:hypothetical protein